MKALLRRIRQILKDRRTRQMLTRIISVTAAVVVFVTTYALVLPAITMEAEAQCGIPAHQHDDSCYSEELVCGEVESPGHHHDESCYSTSTVLVCETEEHAHSVENGCYDENGNLICEKIEHVHSEENSCYEEAKELTCGLEESEGHAHDETCYKKVLTCGLEPHTHSTACYHTDAASKAETESAAVASTESAAVAATEASTDGVSDEASVAASTGTTASTDATAVAEGDGYVPVLEELDFHTLLNKNTGIYYSRPAAPADGTDGSADGVNSDAVEIEPACDRIDKHTTLTESDILRLYLAYTVPVGSLNATNPTARYSLPGNITLTDEQVEQINNTVNGIANQYVDMSTLEILDYDKYQASLGIEAVEGDRTPDQDVQDYLKDLEKAGKDATEFISATVKVENAYDDVSGKYLGQDLVFSFTQYTVEKNQHEYDADGQPTKAGEEVSGWLAIDVTTDQIDWISTGEVETGEDQKQTAEIVFVEKDKELGLMEISSKLTLVPVADESADDVNATDTEDGSEVGGEAATVDTQQGESEDAVSEAEEEKADRANYPAISFEDSITVSAGTLSTDTNVGSEGTASAVTEDTEITVHVEADEDTFPEGTTMKLAAVSDMDAVAEAVEGAMAEAGSADDTDAESADSTETQESQTGQAGKPRTLGFHALDISFRDAEGNEIEPLKPIRVSMSSEAIRRAVEDESTAPVVVHISDSSDSSEGASDGEVGNAAEGATVTDTTVFDDAVSGDATVSVEAGEERTVDNDETETGEVVDTVGTLDTAEDASEPLQDDTERVSRDGADSHTAEIVESATGDSGEAGTGNSSTVEAGSFGESVDDNAANTDATDTVTFETDEFSVYAIVYTVVFSYIDEFGIAHYQYTDGAVTITATAPVGTLPEGAMIRVKEINPFNQIDEDAAMQAAQDYSEALSAVAKAISEEKAFLNRAKAFDISFLDSKGIEIEPQGSVNITLSLSPTVEQEEDKTEEDNGLAHILGNGNADVLEANIGTDDQTGVEDITFSSDTFSVYVVFKSTPDTQLEEPMYLQNGWIRFGGDYKKATSLPNGAHGVNDENGWKNYVKVNLYTLKQGRDSNSMDSNDYDLTSSFQWVAGYDTLTVEDYEFNGQVVFTQFWPADRPIQDPVASLEKGQEFPARTAFHNWTETEWGVFDNVLNIYVNRTSPTPDPQNRTDYVIRYYHADGSYDEKTGYLTSGQTLTIRSSDEIESGEKYSGLTISAGNAAFSSITTSTGEATFGYRNGTSLVKASVYYKSDIEAKQGGTVSGIPLYDTNISNGVKVYDTSRTGLHTDKTATVTSNSSLNDGRTFDLTLETWNIGGSIANVGMVLDASGSMVWTSGQPEEIKYTDNEWRSILGTYRDNYGREKYYYDDYKNDAKVIPPNLVNKILSTANCDYSRLGYNGYKYYIKDPSSDVQEYVPLGYYKGGTMSNYSGHKRVCTDNYYGGSLVNNGSTDLDITAGWYYINTTNSAWYKTYGTAKSYSNYPYRDSNNNVVAWSSNGNAVSATNYETSTKFYIDNTGKLHCKFWRSGNELTSDVYMKGNDSDTKSEVLQNSIAQFAGVLNSLSPKSQVAMTRFSRSDFDRKELVLLNWTDDTTVMSAVLNQTYGGGTSTGYSPQNGINVYNYGFTGNTSTFSGIESYLQKLTNNNANSYTPNATNNAPSKYLIVFTDGKDTDKRDNNNDKDKAESYAATMKRDGYTIFTVFMQSAGMSPSDVSSSGTFLRTLSGKTGEDGNTMVDGHYKYFFSAAYDDPDALVAAFQNIAKQIAGPLEGYMIRDYIDPRFDIVDKDGNILTQLNPQGQWSPRTIETTDGKRAILKYDNDKKMFYLEIEEQTIPTNQRNSTGKAVAVNSTVITVRAKTDFIGGNDILTNGNTEGQNSVFLPAAGSTIHDDSPTMADPDPTKKKDFPKTTTNPATLNITLSNYEDTIFLGETISPASLYNSVQVKRDNAVDYRSLYFNYLLRAGEKLQGDSAYYLNLLKYASIPTGATNTNPAKDRYGNDIPDFDLVTDANGVTTLTLPYYYLENPGDVTSYAGGDLHQADKVGKMTYTWKALTTGGHTLTDNNALKDYTSTTLDTVKYQLSVSYTPDVFVANDSIANNGSARTLALTEQTGADKLIRDPVGAAATAQATDTNTQGLAVIHVVSGKIKVKKRIEISQDNWNKLVTKAGAAGLTFTFTLMKDGADYGTVSINTNSSTATVSGNYIELTSEWITGLPKGNYSLTESAMPTGFTFTSLSADTVVNADGDNNNGTQFAAPTSGSVTWHIGKVVSGTPSATTYGSTDFSYAKVNDTTKEVDPNLEKAYLNAQIGKAIVLNEPPRTTEITITKVDSVTGDALTGAKFSLKEGAAYSNLEGLTITNKTTGAAITTEIITVSGVSVKVFEIPTGGIKIDGLVNGTYTLTEEVIPDGYGAIEGNRTFKAENGVVRKADDSGDYTDEDANFTFKIQNEPGAELPSTGGPGTRLIYLIGLISVFIASAGLVISRSQRRLGSNAA